MLVLCLGLSWFVGCDSMILVRCETADVVLLTLVFWYLLTF